MAAIRRLDLERGGEQEVSHDALKVRIDERRKELGEYIHWRIKGCIEIHVEACY